MGQVGGEDAGDRRGTGEGGGLKTFRCGDVVPGCGAAFTGTERVVLDLVRAHAVRDHGVDASDPGLVAAVRLAMRPA